MVWYKRTYFSLAFSLLEKSHVFFYSWGTCESFVGVKSQGLTLAIKIGGGGTLSVSNFN